MISKGTQTLLLLWVPAVNHCNNHSKLVYSGSLLPSWASLYLSLSAGLFHKPFPGLTVYLHSSQASPFLYCHGLQDFSLEFSNKSQSRSTNLKPLPHFPGSNISHSQVLPISLLLSWRLPSCLSGVLLLFWSPPQELTALLLLFSVFFPDIYHAISREQAIPTISFLNLSLTEVSQSSRKPDSFPGDHLI